MTPFYAVGDLLLAGEIRLEAGDFLSFKGVDVHEVVLPDVVVSPLLGRLAGRSGSGSLPCGPAGLDDPHPVWERSAFAEPGPSGGETGAHGDSSDEPGESRERYGRGLG